MKGGKKFVEVEDLRWFPAVVRKGMLEFLGFFLARIRAYDPVAELIHQLACRTGETEILDLCSGSGRISMAVTSQVCSRGKELTLMMSDLYPQQEKLPTEGFSYYASPLDARNIPEDLNGIRTMFSAMHHFAPHELKAIIKNEAERGKTIAFFDGGDKNLLPFVVILLLFPGLMMVSAPFIKPFSLSRLFFTWAIPLIPLCTIWDGCISVLRLYSIHELQTITGELNMPSYTWKYGQVTHALGFRITYLLGYPDPATSE